MAEKPVRTENVERAVTSGPVMTDRPAPTDRPALTGKPDKSITALVTELRELVVSYAKQETIEPFRGLGRQLAFGVAGALLLGIGGIFGSVAILRALQTETRHLFTSRSWAPYLLTLVVVGAAGFGAVGAATRRKGK